MTQIPAQNQPDVPSVRNAELPDNAVILDVREPHEWALGRAPGAIHIPLGELEARLADLPDQAPLVVTCRGGGRSSRAVAFLRSQGIEAINLTGGMMGWQRDNRPMSHDGPGTPEVR